METKKISFPVKERGKARLVLSPEFDVDEYPDLVVNLDEIRQAANEKDPDYNFRREVFDFLEVDKNTFKIPEEGVQTRAKILFTGHRGCGKSTELRRFYHDLDREEGYLCIFVDSESDPSLGDQFKWQDFFVLLLRGLTAKLEEIGFLDPINASSEPYIAALNNLVGEWVSKKEVVWELSSSYGQMLSENQLPGLEFLRDFFIKGHFAVAYNQNTEFNRSVREAVTDNPVKLVQRINEVLHFLRLTLSARTRYRDLLFIFDGTERINYSEYTQLFHNNLPAVRSIAATVISSIPIAARFTLEGLGQEMVGYERVVLPMFRLPKAEHGAVLSPQQNRHRKLFGQIVTKRIDSNVFLNEGSLALAIDFSGGSPRQLLKLVEISLRISEGGSIEPKHLERAAYRLGVQMFEKLNDTHHRILNQVRAGTFRFSAQKDIADLIAELVLLKYNGHYEINPILNGFDFHE